MASLMAYVIKSPFLGHSLENTLPNTFLGKESNELVPRSSKLVIHGQFQHLPTYFINSLIIQDLTKSLNNASKM